MSKNTLSPKQQESLIATLKARFEKHADRHKGITWSDVKAKLAKNPDKLWSLNEMEKTGGEPDVVAYNTKNDEFVFFDCSPESPAGRRSLCYDREGLESRKEHQPEDTAIDMAHAMGVEILNEDDYRTLQKLGEFDLKTSSWLLTPPAIRKLGGSIFGDRRYDTIFIYHNGAQSYYAGRGFRASVKI